MANADGTEFTWQQKLRFFILGIVWAAVGALPPVAVTLWDMVHNYSDPIDWHQLEILTVASVGPAVLGYWRSHKNLLEVPPGLVIPDEFQPTKTTVKAATTVTTTDGIKQVETSVTKTTEPVAAPVVQPEPSGEIK